MNLKTPRGVKDFLPSDAKWKIKLEQEIREAFQNWGYQEVISPTFEFDDVLAPENTSPQQTYRFFDHNGELLVLRSDLTTPIARMVATRLKDVAKPLRLSYIANVFRYDDVQVGFQREFYQGGVELIGSSSPAADAEVAALAVFVFNQLGVANFSLDLGHTQYIDGVLAECNCEKTKTTIWQMLLKKDLVGLKNIVTACDLPQKTKELLLDLPHFRGNDSLLAEAYDRTESVSARAAVDNLQQIYTYLEGYGLQKQVQIDLSITKSLDYYSGMVLEGYVPDLGFTICSGGRYDGLNGQFGNELPAVGFALGLERAMLVLEQQGRGLQVKPDGVLVLPISWSHALKYATEQRQKGFKVEIALDSLERESALSYAQEKNLTAVVIVDKDKIETILVEQV